MTTWTIISIHALLAESDMCHRVDTKKVCISIHALLAESDKPTIIHDVSNSSISIHALLAESDDSGNRNLTSHCDFYPRSPCGERLIVHALKLARPVLFLSTLSLRRATGRNEQSH